MTEDCAEAGWTKCHFLGGARREGREREERQAGGQDPGGRQGGRNRGSRERNRDRTGSSYFERDRIGVLHTRPRLYHVTTLDSKIRHLKR